VQAPTGLNFDLAAARKAQEAQADHLAGVGAAQHDGSTQPTASAFLSDDEGERSLAHQAHDDTFLTRDHDFSILDKEPEPRTSSTRGRGGPTIRGRGRGGKVVLTKRQKDERIVRPFCFCAEVPWPRCRWRRSADRTRLVSRCRLLPTPSSSSCRSPFGKSRSARYKAHRSRLGQNCLAHQSTR